MHLAGPSRVEARRRPGRRRTGPGFRPEAAVGRDSDIAVGRDSDLGGRRRLALGARGTTAGDSDITTRTRIAGRAPVAGFGPHDGWLGFDSDMVSVTRVGGRARGDLFANRLD